MRLCALLILSLSLLSSVYSILADEAYQVDYHQALLGIPQGETTLFHRPSASSSASLLYTISEKAVLGAVNPKDGSLVWRQSLAGPLPESHRVMPGVGELSDEEQLKAFRDTGPLNARLLAKDGSGFVFSYYGATVSAWHAMTGKLLWQRVMPQGEHIKNARLVPHLDGSSSSSVVDVVVLFGTRVGVVTRLDGSSGAVVWEHRDTSGAVPRFLASTEEGIYYASEQGAVLGTNSIKITFLDVVDGREADTYSLKADDILCVASCPDLAFISWYEKSSKRMKVNVLGSNEVHTIVLEKTDGDNIQEVSVLSGCGRKSPSFSLVHIKSNNGAWAEVLHIGRGVAEVRKAYSLPYLREKDAFAVSDAGEELYFTRITDLELQLHSFASGNVLARWPRSQPSFGGPVHAQAEVVVREGSNYAIRTSETSKGGEWTLMRNGEQVWSRPEMLAHAVAAAWAEDISGEALAHELDLEGHENPLRAYAHRVKRHLRDLQYLPGWLQQMPSNIMSGLLTPQSETEKGLLGSKSLIVATSTGQYVALDPIKSGAIKWKRLAFEASGKAHDAISLHVDNGIVTSFVSGFGIITMNATDGRDISLDHASGHFTGVAITPGPVASVAYRILRDGQPEATATDDVAKDGTYLVTKSELGSEVQGWLVGRSNEKLWKFSRGDGYSIVNVVARSAHDPVASIGKVLGDRSVLYKYLSENLVLITSVKSDWFTIDLLDAITGTILYSATHHKVDTRSPIPSAMSENWFTYSFFGNEHATSPAKSHQIVVVELYESSIPNDRGPLQSSSNYSSFNPGSVTRPYSITQSFTISHPISHMSVTQTAQGITSRQLLCTLPTLNAIIGIPRYILDPRRPVDRDATPQEAAEEGLFRYSPVLDLEPRFFLTHAREVMGIQKIISSPTLLESTGLVFAFGLDVFGTRVTPSKAFDVLGKGFNKIALILTVVALATGTAGLAPLVRRRQVERAWRM